MKNCSPSRGRHQASPRSNENYWIRSPLRAHQNKDEDLALFHDMRTLESKNFLHPSTDDMESSLSTKLGELTGFRICASPAPSWKGNDLLAMAESDKTDYDWLLTPPGTPLFPSLDKDSLQNYMDRCTGSQPCLASKGSRFLGSNTPELQRTARKSPGPRTPVSLASSTSSSHSVSRGRAPSPSRAGSSPTLRPSTPSKTLGRPTSVVNRASTRSSPPILRRTNTSPTTRSQSIERNATPSKPRNSMSPKLQAWQAPELGFSAEPPPNLRTSVSDRPTSNMRSGTRPRVGAQEGRHHQEARHSYSDAIESRRQHWRTYSSSTSRLSSSTTSQERWSSRGSVFSSSDDGVDVIEPTFLDFCVTSPSSTSGTSRTVSGRQDLEVASKCSPALSRQKSSQISTVETVRNSSASARKSLESSMRRVNHSQVPQTMFRPLMTSAPTTSYCSNERTIVRQKPANCFVEPSITASSNASSERGVRIFPGNDSSEEEVESEWCKSLPSAASSTRKFPGNNLADGSYRHIQDCAEHYEPDSVADSASTSVMDGCETQRITSSKAWERENFQANFVASLKEEDLNQGMPESPVKKTALAHVMDPVDQARQYGNAQQASADAPVAIDRDNVLKGSVSLNPDPIKINMSDSGQEETEVCDVRQEGSTLCIANDDMLEDASKKSIANMAVSPSERHTNMPGLHSAAQIQMGPSLLESSSAMPIHESKVDSESHSPSTDVGSVFEPLSSVLVDSLKLGVNDSGQYLTVVGTQGTSLKNIGKTCSHAFMSEEASPRDNILCSNDSNAARIPVQGPILGDETQAGSPIIGDKKPSFNMEFQGDMNSVPCTSGSDLQVSLAGQTQCSLQHLCGEDHTSTLEDINQSTTLEKCLVFVDERDVVSKNLCDLERAEADKGTCMSHGISAQHEDIKRSHEGLPGYENSASLSQDDEENLQICNNLTEGRLSSLEIPNSGSEGNGYCQIGAIIAAQGSTDCILVAEASKEEYISNCANIPQVLYEVQPDCSSDTYSKAGGTQQVAVSTLVDTSGSPASELNLLNKADGQHQPQKDSPLISTVSAVERVLPPSFSLEEATNTILFCNSIIHDIIYKAASIATDKEMEAMKVASPWVSQSRGQLANSAFISSLRGKMSKSATRKARPKEAKASYVVSSEEGPEPPATITDRPGPVLAMVREPAIVEADKPQADNSKDKSFMGISVNNNCQCSIM